MTPLYMYVSLHSCAKLCKAALITLFIVSIPYKTLCGKDGPLSRNNTQVKFCIIIRRGPREENKSGYPDYVSMPFHDNSRLAEHKNTQTKQLEEKCNRRG